MQTRAQKLASIKRPEEVRADLIESAVKEQAYAAVEAVFDRMIAHSVTSPEEIRLRIEAIRTIVNSFALAPGLNPAQRTLALVLRLPPGLDLLPACMERLAYQQPTAVIENLLAETPHLEAAGFLLHNAVVMEKIPADNAVAQSVQTQLAAVQHPLAWLPLTLLPIEATIERPSLGLHGNGCATNITAFNHEIKAPAVVADYDIPAETVADVERSRRITTAFHSWEFEGADKTAGEIFFLEGGIPANLSAILPRLGLRFLSVEDQVGFRPIQPPGVFERLFSGSILGPAYGPTADMAWSRLQAWRSLTGLTGAEAQAPAEAVAKLAENCRWCLFFTDNQWFCGDLCDLGIVCANDSRREIAVLAATDTD